MPGLSTLELALSVRCLNHSVANVPKNYDYKYGCISIKTSLGFCTFFSWNS